MKSKALMFLAAGLLLSTGAQASQADAVRASHAWLRVLPGDLPAGAYVTLENKSDQPAALTGASSRAYAEVALHQSSSEGGMSRMAMVDSVTVPAHGTATLAPAGYHFMLMKSTHPVKPGDAVPMRLKFADGSVLATDFVARPANAMDGG